MHFWCIRFRNISYTPFSALLWYFKIYTLHILETGSKGIDMDGWTPFEPPIILKNLVQRGLH